VPLHNDVILHDASFSLSFMSGQQLLPLGVYQIQDMAGLMSVTISRKRRKTKSGDSDSEDEAQSSSSESSASEEEGAKDSDDIDALFLTHSRTENPTMEQQVYEAVLILNIP
jgi:hypothetical protein